MGCVQSATLCKERERGGRKRRGWSGGEGEREKEREEDQEVDSTQKRLQVADKEIEANAKMARSIRGMAGFHWLLTIRSVHGNTSRPSASDWQLRSRTLNFASSSSLTSPHDFFNSPTTLQREESARESHLAKLSLTTLEV